MLRCMFLILEHHLPINTLCVYYQLAFDFVKSGEEARNTLHFITFL